MNKILLLPARAFLGAALLSTVTLHAEDAAPSGVVAAVLQPFVDRHALAGAVTLVASKDAVLDVETVGFADIAKNKPMTPDALFWIASQSKPITATAFMMLVDEGKVNLDDPVEKYLPEFRGQMVAVFRDAATQLLRKPGHPITIRETLSHTSGLPFQSPMEVPTLDGLSLRDAVRSYALVPLNAEPGTKYDYSNAGINTAARILEVVSGMPYEDFMQTRLFTPLGMKDTTFWPTPEQEERVAKVYKPKAEKSGLELTTISQLIYPLANRKQRYPMPAGGLFSTAADTARFCQMILNGGTLDGKRYVSEAAVKEMSRKQTSDAIKQGYGLGWFLNGGEQFGHGGAEATNMNIDPQRGLVEIFMVQHTGFPADGGKSFETFKQAAEQRFGSAQK